MRNKVSVFSYGVLAIVCLSLAGCAKVESISLAAVPAMEPGDTAQLALNYDFGKDTPSEKDIAAAEAKLTLTYASSDETVATVDATGLVTAVAAGKATVTVSCGIDGIPDATTEVTVQQPVTKVSVTPGETSVEQGKTKTLTAQTQPGNATIGTNKTWKSDNESVATVDKNGTVTGVSEGTANITVTTDNGISASSKVTVSSTEKDTGGSDAGSNKEKPANNASKSTKTQNTASAPSNTTPAVDTTTNTQLQSTPTTPAQSESNTTQQNTSVVDTTPKDTPVVETPPKEEPASSVTIVDGGMGVVSGDAEPDTVF